MSTQPSEHAQRASKALDGGDIEAHIIDHHAIAPAVAERDRRIAELEARIAKQNAIIDRLNHCGSDTERIEWLERMCFDLTESKGRWCVSDFIVERAHYGKTVREAVDAVGRVTDCPGQIITAHWMQTARSTAMYSEAYLAALNEIMAGKANFYTLSHGTISRETAGLRGAP
jgi:hypothetical protein